MLRGSSGLPRGPGVILPGRRPVRTPESSMGSDPSLSIELGLGWASDIPRENGGKFSIYTQLNPLWDAYGFFVYSCNSAYFSRPITLKLPKSPNSNYLKLTIKESAVLCPPL